MLKKALAVLSPFALIFLIGCALLLRPQYRVQIVEVENTFVRQEKTSPRSTHRHSVYYATVKVEFDGTLHDVTVHDNTWMPLKAGDSVIITRGIGGRIIEYSPKNGYILMALSALIGAMMLGIMLVRSRWKK